MKINKQNVLRLYKSSNGSLYFTQAWLHNKHFECRVPMQISTVSFGVVLLLPHSNSLQSYHNCCNVIFGVFFRVAPQDGRCFSSFLVLLAEKKASTIPLSVSSKRLDSSLLLHFCMLFYPKHFHKVKFLGFPGQYSFLLSIKKGI
jgi:hypothetical protein